MNIKYYRPAKDGTHTFSPYRDFSLVDSSTIVEMRPFDSEYINSFKYDLYDFTKEEDKTRIFFRECPAYTLLYQFSPKDTGQSKVK